VRKNLDYYLNLNYPITITKDEDEGEVYFEAEIPDLPGCGSYGKTIEEALNNLEEAKKLWLEVSLERGLPIPEPIREEKYSGKFLLRIPPKLHMKLALNAKKEGLSLNQYVNKILETFLSTELILKEIQELKQEINKLKSKILSEIPGHKTSESAYISQNALDNNITFLINQEINNYKFQSLR